MLQFTYTCINNLMEAKGRKQIPKEPGLYVVDTPHSDFVLIISSNSCAPVAKLYLVAELEKKLEGSDKSRIYIGKAQNLRKRIACLIRYGQGKTTSHSGGKAIWQITNVRELLLGWAICQNPREIEKEMLIAYRNKFGYYPMANWQC